MIYYKLEFQAEKEQLEDRIQLTLALRDFSAKIKKAKLNLVPGEGIAKQLEKDFEHLKNGTTPIPCDSILRYSLESHFLASPLSSSSHETEPKNRHFK